MGITCKKLKFWWCRTCQEETLHLDVLCNHCGTHRKVVKAAPWKPRPFTIRNRKKRARVIKTASGGKSSPRTADGRFAPTLGNTFGASTGA